MLEKLKQNNLIQVKNAKEKLDQISLVSGEAAKQELADMCLNPSKKLDSLVRPDVSPLLVSKADARCRHLTLSPMKEQGQAAQDRSERIRDGPREVVSRRRLDFHVRIPT